MRMEMLMANDDQPDLLSGHAEIGEYLGMSEREAKHLATIDAIPTFRLPGSRIVRARRSSLKLWLREREAADLAAKHRPPVV